MDILARLANLPGALPGACAQGLIWGIMAIGWFGVTYREDKPYVMGELKKLHDAGQYPESLLYDKNAP